YLIIDLDFFTLTRFKTCSTATVETRKCASRVYIADKRDIAPSISEGNCASRSSADARGLCQSQPLKIKIPGRLLGPQPEKGAGRLLFRSRQNLTRERAREFASIHYRLPVDQHEIDPLGILMRIGEGRAVTHRGGVEDDQVGGQTFANQPSIVDPQYLRGQ